MCVSTMLVFGIEMELPHLFEQHLARHDAALAAQQEFEQPEFARLQVDVLAAAPNGAGDEIHFEIARLQHGRRRSERRAARERVEPRHQLLEGERLDEIVVAAGLESVDPVVDAGEVGEEEHRRRHALRPHQRDDAEPVELRQHAVEDDHIETIGGRPLESFATVPRDRRLVPARFEARRDEVGGPLVVLDNQNLHPAALAETRDVAIRARPHRNALSPSPQEAGMMRQPQSGPQSSGAVRDRPEKAG